MSFNLTKCPHIESLHYSHVDVKTLEEGTSCGECDYTGLNLWICLYHGCYFIGCSEQAKDHSTEHFKLHKHAVHMNISSQRIWCYFCERELYVNNINNGSDDNIFSYALSSLSSQVENLCLDRRSTTSSDSCFGLVGLQNIANTCYMNSALQALSNLIPMTHYFINCSNVVEHIADQNAPRCKSSGLAKSYQRLMHEMWTTCYTTKDFIAPRGILYGIRIVHPMFRGYQQHDTQEFLRCFMDQLHEELKDQNIACYSGYSALKTKEQDSDAELVNDLDGNVKPSDVTDSEYETCESSISERSTPNPNEQDTQQKADYYLQAQQRTLSGGDTTKKLQKKSQNQPQQRNNNPRSIISDVFDGKLLSSVQCLTCDRISAREETFQDLSLPIPNRDFLNVLHQTQSVQSLNVVDTTARNNDGWIWWMWNTFRSWLYGPSVTLYDCMASFFSADELKGDNMYSCEKCNKLRTGVKYSRILNLPEVLCIHLKRFRHDLSYSSKIGSHVYFPLEGFDMRSYLHKDCQSTVPLYNLSSVICHHGTVGGGHYTCYARNSLNGCWYEFDDQFVTEVTPETVQNCQAYVLFYQKHNPQMQLVREQARNMSDSYPSQHSDIQFYISRDWLTRLATFSEPGPINNYDILCPHGGVLEAKMSIISEIAVPISQPVWDFLYQKFGGGPAISMLFECEICKRDAEALARRQFYELAVFTKYNGLQCAELETSAIYAIAMPWLRKWQQFSRGLTHKEPGPIANENIVVPLEQPSTSNIRTVRPGSDYAQLNAPLWRFLHDIYGGGPDILIRGSISEELEIVDQDESGDSIKQHNTQDVSDTESNIGRRHTPEPDNTKLTTTELSSSSANGSFIQHSQVAKDLKYNKISSVNTKRLKVVGLQNTALRKKTRKSRNALKHADMFGAKGSYNPNNENADNSIGSTSLQSDKVTSTEAQQAADAFKNEYNTSFQNGNSRASNLRTKRHHRNKENLKMQKFIALQKSSELNETDA